MGASVRREDKSKRRNINRASTRQKYFPLFIKICKSKQEGISMFTEQTGEYLQVIVISLGRLGKCGFWFQPFWAGI